MSDDDSLTPAHPKPSQLRITPRSANQLLGRPWDPPPIFPAEGTDGAYVCDSGPLLSLGFRPDLLAIARSHFGDRMRIPSKVAEELRRLAQLGGSALLRSAAEQAHRVVTSGFPVVETLTTEETAFADETLLKHLLALAGTSVSQARGQHLGECHAVALALRIGRESTIVLTNDGPASRLARSHGLCARSINGMLRELVISSDNTYSAAQAFADVGLMVNVSAPPASDRAKAPEDFR